MTKLRHIVIGTRGSALARKQAEIAAKVLKEADQRLLIDVKVIETYGDAHQDPIPLDEIGKGWFTKEIEQALLKKTIDLAVHSLKDMEHDVPDLVIGAYLRREDARDVLITKLGESLAQLKKGAVVGTDSVRRQIQIRALRPDIETKSLRGNVPTRLEKLASEDYDAIILAAAGLKRLGLENCITHYFEPEEMTPAPGQGTLAVQIRAGDTTLAPLLSAINDEDAAISAEIERSFSRRVGGGCKSPTGAYAAKNGRSWQLTGMMQDTEGRIIREKMHSDSAAQLLGDHLAELMLKRLEKA